MSDSAPGRLIEVFGRETCTDTRRTRDLLERLGVDYRFHDVEGDARERAVAVALSGGTRVPVVRLTDGVIGVEPTDEWMLARIGTV
ncbi:glutaredoxin [Microbacterium trichothecenolyticum]|uniref:glutaredoxin family protein n=1 Tax=Microbacterium trichothecenolyticum TaxID=69370 RepID=UPI00285959CA|nr:glutaredoxin [Microbacterium trichothecenolyticum]MDR7183274.1 glutaredoxin [Microbacterium trichothecenolyticum]